MHSPENSEMTEESQDPPQPSMERIFHHTLQVLRQQRDSNADLVVQVSARAMALDEIIASQQKSMKELQDRYDDLYKTYYQDKCKVICDGAKDTLHHPV